MTQRREIVAFGDNSLRLEKIKLARHQRLKAEWDEAGQEVERWQESRRLPCHVCGAGARPVLSTMSPDRVWLCADHQFGRVDG